MKTPSQESARVVVDTQLTLAYALSKLLKLPQFYVAFVENFHTKTLEDLFNIERQRDVYVYMTFKAFNAIGVQFDPEDANNVLSVSFDEKVSRWKLWTLRDALKKDIQLFLDISLDSHRWASMYMTYGGKQEGFRDLTNKLKEKFLELAKVKEGDQSWMSQRHQDLLNKMTS